jgi:predicted type IV restriction endonuclease
MPTALELALQRLTECSTEKPSFPEAVVEAIILLDLFRGALGFDRETSKRQVRAGHGKSDIVLELNKKPKVSIVVEIKQHGCLSNKNKRDAAVRQAAGYALKLKPPQHYGIVTDGNYWTYFMAKPENKERGNSKTKYDPQEIRKILEFTVTDNPELAHVVLIRSNKNTLHKLFRLLGAIHGDITKDSLDELLDKGFTERVQYLTSKAQLANLTCADADTDIIKMLYKGGAPLIPPIFGSMTIFPPKAAQRQKPPVSKSHVKKKPTKTGDKSSP